jgi:hypothetical protein
MIDVVQHTSAKGATKQLQWAPKALKPELVHLSLAFFLGPLPWHELLVKKILISYP